MKENMEKRVSSLEGNRQELKKDLAADLSALSDEELRLLEKVVDERERLINKEGFQEKGALEKIEKELSESELADAVAAISKIQYK